MCRLAITKHVAGIENKIVQPNKIRNFTNMHTRNYIVSLTFVHVIKTGDGLM